MQGCCTAALNFVLVTLGIATSMRSLQLFHTCVQALFCGLAMLDNTKPIIVACEGLGPYVSDVLHQLDCDSEPVASSSRLSHLPCCLRCYATSICLKL